MAARIKVLILGLSAGLLAAQTELQAADMVSPVPVEAPAEDGWTFAAAPYLWMAGVHGDVGQFGFPPITVDASFSDVLNHFDIGFMGAAELRNDRWALVSDIIYTRVSADRTTRAGLLADGVDVTSKLFTALAAGSYRFIDAPSGNLDAVVGARIWSVHTDIDLVNSRLPVTSFRDGDSWVDPVIGLKGRYNMTDRTFLIGSAMVGGFGAGSKITWDVLGGAGYAVSDMVSLVGGYRALGVDYSKNDFVFDVVQQGPFLGATIKF